MNAPRQSLLTDQLKPLRIEKGGAGGGTEREEGGGPGGGVRMMVPGESFVKM